MWREIKLGDISVDVLLKDIKNIHLSVHPPTGRVRISAPSRMSMDSIRVFAISKLSWIKQQQQKIQQQERETPREYLDRESHYVWGKRYLLEVIESNEAPTIELQHNRMCMWVRPGVTAARKQAAIEAWYRRQLKNAVRPLIAKWEAVLGVGVERFFVQKMKTKWGSCNAASRGIRLNSELAKKPIECLEYILVHEMLHFLVRHHNDQFFGLMDRYYPNWTIIRQILNDAPLGHQEWAY
jgi:predicted metal-dependent hydrolase